MLRIPVETPVNVSQSTSALETYLSVMNAKSQKNPGLKRDLKKVRTNRDLVEYPDELQKKLDRGSVHKWLDVGCGDANALKGCKKQYPDIFCAGLDMRNFEKGKIDLKIVGDVSALNEIDHQFDLISDIYGAASYSNNPITVIDTLLKKLTLNGNLYVVTDIFDPQMSPLKTVLSHFRGSIVIDDSGKLVRLDEFLKANSTGLEFSSYNDENIISKFTTELKIEKTSEKYQLPDLVPVCIRDDLPPLIVLIKRETLKKIQDELQKSGKDSPKPEIAAQNVFDHLQKKQKTQSRQQPGLFSKSSLPPRPALNIDSVAPRAKL